MKIFVTAKPASKINEVTQIDATHFIVKVKAPPQDGKANEAIIDVLAEFLEVPKSSLEMKAGHTAKKKVVEVLI